MYDDRCAPFLLQVVSERDGRKAAKPCPPVTFLCLQAGPAPTLSASSDSPPTTPPRRQRSIHVRDALADRGADPHPQIAGVAIAAGASSDVRANRWTRCTSARREKLYSPCARARSARRSNRLDAARSARSLRALARVPSELRGSICERSLVTSDLRGSICERSLVTSELRKSMCERSFVTSELRGLNRERSFVKSELRKSMCERSFVASDLRGSNCERSFVKSELRGIDLRA